MSCPICEKRKATRFCPAKGEQICAVCCGKEREVTIDCPVDCLHLLAAHRYEAEHPRPVPPDTPFFDVHLPPGLTHTHGQFLAALAFTIVKFCAANREASDPDVLTAVQSLAETYKTLRSGIYYEKPPDARMPRELYSALTAFIDEVKQQEAERSGFSSVKDSDIFYLLVGIYQTGVMQANGRRRSRRYIEYLRGQFPEAKDLQRETSRVIVP